MSDKKLTKKGEEIRFFLSEKSFFVWLFVIGFLLYLLGYFVKTTTQTSFWLGLFDHVAENFSLVLISSGFVSVAIEISTIKNVVKKAVEQILDGDFDFTSYSSERLKKISMKIAVLRCKKEKMQREDLMDSVYSLEPYLLANAKGLYYEKHKATFVLTPKSDVMIKNVLLDFTIVNKYKAENKVEFTIASIHKDEDVTAEEVRKNFKVNEFKIEKEDLISEVDECIEIIENSEHRYSTYKYKVRFCRKLQECVRHRVQISYEYAIPITDIMQSYRLPLPCKEMEHSVEIVGSEWKLMPTFFASFGTRGDDDTPYRIVQNTSSNVSIQFRDWANAGTGYAITLCKVGGVGVNHKKVVANVVDI